MVPPVLNVLNGPTCIKSVNPISAGVLENQDMQLVLKPGFRPKERALGM